jgi:hypothetical protein
MLAIELPWIDELAQSVPKKRIPVVLVAATRLLMSENLLSR